MEFRTKNWYHVYNQGNNKQRIFYEKKNYFFFLSKVNTIKQPGFDIIAYCLMPNHFHFLVYTDFDRNKEIEQSKVYSNKIGSLLSSYTKAMNNRYNRSGSLFRQRTKAKRLAVEEQINEKYVLTCFHYIHQNPLRAGLVKELKEWPYSSYRDYAEFRKGRFPNIKRGKELLGIRDSKEFIRQGQMAIDPKILKNIW